LTGILATRGEERQSKEKGQKKKLLITKRKVATALLGEKKV